MGKQKSLPKLHDPLEQSNEQSNEAKHTLTKDNKINIIFYFSI